jgi:hypothetical protein
VPDYRVYRGKVFLGSLTRTATDMPWYEGTFDATRAFEAIRPLFDREHELLYADRMDEWSEAWMKLAKGLRLEPADGSPAITAFLLHIVGRQAHWRF